MYVEKGKVQGKCDACGHKSDLDNKHKFAEFLHKNPPPKPVKKIISNAEKIIEEEKKKKEPEEKKVEDVK